MCNKNIKIVNGWNIKLMKSYKKQNENKKIRGGVRHSTNKGYIKSKRRN